MISNTQKNLDVVVGSLAQRASLTDLFCRKFSFVTAKTLFGNSG
jgi:hypothetical protein